LRVSARLLLLLIAGLALCAAFLLALALGSVSIPLSEIVIVLTGGESSRESWTNIVLKVRLPKALTAALAGAALSAAGLLMQTLFRNPLADPFTLGISSGASLGVALMVLSVGSVGGALLMGFGLVGDSAVVFAASVGAGVVLLLALSAARRVQGTVTLLILGLMFGYISGGLVTLLMHTAVPERIQAYTNWTFGSFGGVTWGQMPVFAASVLVGLALALALAKPLNALLLGDTYARSLGVNLRRARAWIVVSAALLAGGVTAFCGPVGFIGIAVPHICRGIFRTADHRVLLPASLVVGATAALLAALVAEMPGTRVVLPLNAITALVGAPIVIAVVLRQRAARAAFEGA
jgi:iron complex transport system permease protein